MEVSQIIELMKAVSDNGLTDFTYEENGIRLKMRNQTQAIPIASMPIQYTEASTIPSQVIDEIPEMPITGKTVNSPLVGTFYAASSPDADPYVKVGDIVHKGQVLGIVEAMKLMNEIESEFDGVVKEILVANGQLIEFDQPMFVIE